MTSRTSTVVLRIEDDFSQPLDSYADKVGRADEATAQMAAGAEQSAAATAELAAGVQQAAEAESGMSISVDEASDAWERQNSAGQGARATLLELYAGVALVKQGLSALKDVYDGTIGKTVALSQEVRQLSFDIGASAEDASKLIYASNVMGISVDTLSRALEAAIRTMKSSRSEGIEPNIEGLAKLADMYNAIQDPVLQTKFLMDNFGRSGAAIAPLMKLGSAGIKDLGDQAQATGNVLSGDAAEGMARFNIGVNKLKADLEGFGIQVGLTVLHLSDAWLTWDRGNELVRQGAISQEKFNRLWADASNGAMTYADALGQLNAIQAEQNRLMAIQDPLLDRNVALLDREAFAKDRAAEAAKGYTYETNNNILAVLKLHSLLEQQFAAQDAVSDAMHRASVAQDALNASQALSAGLAGTVTKNYEAYQKVVDGNAEKIAKLKDEIAKLTAANGKQITVVTEGTVRQGDYDLAVERAAYAQEKYQAALAGTVDKQGKLHEASALTLEGLRIAAESAQNSVDKLAEKMGSTTTVTADYHTRIGEDQAALDELTLANSRAKDAMHEANKEFVYQQAAAGLTGQAALDLALAFGQIDKPTYDATIAIQKAKDQFAKDGDLLRFESGLRLIIDKLNGVPPAADPIPEVLAPATQAFKDMQTPAEAAARGVDALYRALGFYNGVHVDATVTTHFETTGTPPPGYYAGLPGYNPGGGNDATGSGGSNDPFGTYPGGTNGVGRTQSNNPGLVFSPRQPGNGGGAAAAAAGASGGRGDTIIINNPLAAALYLQRRREGVVGRLNRLM